MSPELHWSDILVRLVLTVFAAAVIGIDRGEHGRPAGLRTTILVCLAASVSMIQVNLMLNLSGKPASSYVMLDLMRLPLGILSGMGFIGAGAIIKYEKNIMGVTTPATLWFVTVMGLCFGAGQIGLGLGMLSLGFATLFILRGVDDFIRQDRRATIKILLTRDGPSDQEIRNNLLNASFKILSLGITYTASRTRIVECNVQWHACRTENHIPNVIASLANQPGVRRIQWQP